MTEEEEEPQTEEELRTCGTRSDRETETIEADAPLSTESMTKNQTVHNSRAD